jgi:hypothetical protein
MPLMIEVLDFRFFDISVATSFQSCLRMSGQTCCRSMRLVMVASTRLLRRVFRHPLDCRLFHGSGQRTQAVVRAFQRDSNSSFGFLDLVLALFLPEVPV